MDSNSQLAAQFVLKLVRLTVEGKLRWELSENFADDSIYSGFQSALEGTSIRISRFREKRYVSKPGRGGLFGLSTAQVDYELSTVEGVYLDFLDRYGRVSVRLDGTVGLENLFRVVSASASGVTDLMRRVVEEDAA